MENIFTYAPIMGVTINTVWLSPVFRLVLLWSLAVVLCAGLAVFLARRHPPLQALRRAAMSAFFAGGLLFALHADIGWSRWLAADHRAFSGKTTDEKLRTLEGPLYDFVLQSRRALSTDFTLLNDSSGNYLTRRYQYFMLPLRARPDAPAVVVIGDRDARYDPETGILSRGDMVIRNARPLLLFMQDAYIIARPGGGNASPQ